MVIVIVIVMDSLTPLTPFAPLTPFTPLTTPITPLTPLTAWLKERVLGQHTCPYYGLRPRSPLTPFTPHTPLTAWLKGEGGGCLVSTPAPTDCVRDRHSLHFLYYSLLHSPLC